SATGFGSTPPPGGSAPPDLGEVHPASTPTVSKAHSTATRRIITLPCDRLLRSDGEIAVAAPTTFEVVTRIELSRGDIAEHDFDLIRFVLFDKAAYDAFHSEAQSLDIL